MLGRLGKKPYDTSMAWVDFIEGIMALPLMVLLVYLAWEVCEMKNIGVFCVRNFKVLLIFAVMGLVAVLFL